MEEQTQGYPRIRLLEDTKGWTEQQKARSKAKCVHYCMEVNWTALLSKCRFTSTWRGEKVEGVSFSFFLPIPSSVKWMGYK